MSDVAWLLSGARGAAPTSALFVALLMAPQLARAQVAPSEPAPPTAAEQEAAARLRARAVGEEALRHYDAERWELALAKLTEADAIVAAPTFRLYAARSLARLGRLIEADRRYGEAAAMDLPPDASAVLLEARETARREQQELAARIPTVSFVFYSGQPTRVAIDGKQAEPAGGHRLDPGRHSIEVTSPGGRALRRDVVLRLGERRTETFDFGSASGAATTGGATDGGSTGGTQRALGVVTLGVGAAGLATWGVTGGLALSEASDRGCEGGECSSPDEELGTLRALRTTSTVAFYAGIALSTTGVILLLTAPSDEASVALTATPGGLSAAGRFW